MSPGCLYAHWHGVAIETLQTENKLVLHWKNHLTETVQKMKGELCIQLQKAFYLYTVNGFLGLH